MIDLNDVDRAPARPLSPAQPATRAEARARLIEIDDAIAAALAFVAWMLRLFRRRGYVTRYS